MLAPVLDEFRARYPDVHLDVLLSNDRLDLVANEIDVALRVGELPDSTLIARRLATWPTQVFASEGYLARSGEPLVPEDLWDHHVLASVWHRRNQGYAWPLTDGTRQEEFEVKPVVVANDPQVMLSLLAAGQGLMLTSELLIRCMMPAASVRRVLGSWRGPNVHLNAVYVGGRVLSPKVRAFVDFVADYMQARCEAEECPGVAPRAVQTAAEAQAGG